jgi:spore germination protein GerM
VRRPAAHSLALLVAGAVLLVSCGRGSGPVEVPTDEIPFPLERSPGTPTASPSASGTVYLVKDGGLVPVGRDVSAALPRDEAVMRALLEGPTAQERTDGLRTAIPPATGLIDVAVFEGVAQVDLSNEFQGPAPPEDVLLRVAQVVWTLVAVPDIVAVRFAIDGEPISVITDGATMVDRPVTAPDYASVAPTQATASVIHP